MLIPRLVRSHAEDQPVTGDVPAGALWIDLYNPTDEEIAAVKQATGLRVPGFAEIREIESSSRLQFDDDVFQLSTPVVYRDGTGGPPHTTAIGFVLTAKVLLTIRSEQLPSFEQFAKHCHTIDPRLKTSAGAFIGILEALVDRSADALESITSDLDQASHRIFSSDTVEGTDRKREAATLQAMLRRVGKTGDFTFSLRATLLGAGRLAAFVAGTAEWLTAEEKHRLETVRQDVTSLADYETRISDKIQFLLDATLGFISIDQNNTFKVLTIASVIGIPPTLIASLYGMNFKIMPELEWTYGYPYALTLIALSAIVPTLYLKWRGWF